MGSAARNQFRYHHEPQLCELGGLILTDSSGNPLNAIPAPATLDEYGNSLVPPKGIASVTKLQTGMYRITLSEAWLDLYDVTVTPYVPAPLAREQGTADLTKLTLSSLNTETLITHADVGSSYTTTFTTPSSIANIAAQINAGNAGTSVVASIYINTATGAQYLVVQSSTIGSTSSIAVSGTSLANLGLTASTPTGSKAGSFLIAGYNVQGSDINYQPAQTIDVVYQIAGVGGDIVSGGFWINVVCKSINAVV